MNCLKKALLPFAAGMFFVTLVQAGNAPQAQTGTILSESSVNCGSKGESHKRSVDLLCQGYAIRTASTDYQVRQEKPTNQSLVPVNTKVEFTINKDKIKFKIDGKSYEYVVVSETAIAAARP
jgi:hypothetical protein